MSLSTLGVDLVLDVDCGVSRLTRLFDGNLGDLASCKRSINIIILVFL